MSAIAGLMPRIEPQKEGPKAEFLSWFQNAPGSLALCDSQGCVLAMNPAMERLLGSAERLETVHLSDLISPAGGQHSELIAQLLAGLRDSVQIEFAAGEPPKSMRWVAWRVSRLGGAVHTVASAEALLPAKRTAAATDGFEVLGRLTGGVAHDFNNLLTGVLLYCDLLRATLHPNDRAHRYADEIRKAGFEASDLVRQLLSLAKPASGGEHSFSLNDTVEGMRRFLTRIVGENIELKLNLDPNLGAIRMNPAKAQQILLNLVLNARDAMPRGGSITVDTRDCKIELLADSSFTGKPEFRCALLGVADNGSGIDPDTRAHLFEPFFTTKAGKGSGLGLATIRDIISSHGGLVHVHTAIGCGTRFSIFLPVFSELPAAVLAHNDFRSAESAELDSSNEEE